MRRVLLALAALAILPSTASAAVTVSDDGTTIQMNDAPGAASIVGIAKLRDGTFQIGANTGATAGAGCTQSGGKAICPAGATTARVDLGDGNDNFTPNPGIGLTFVVDGGPGDDTIYGDSGNDTLTGGPGEDDIVGQGGDDTIDAADGYQDGIACGDGNDTVSADPSLPGIVDADRLTDCEYVTSAAAGSAAAVKGDASSVIYGGVAGAANDVTIGQTAGTLTFAEPGGIRAIGDCAQVDATHASCPTRPTRQVNLGDGNDTAHLATSDGINVLGGPGDDTITGGPGPDDLEGGDGNDTIHGGPGNDLVIGGAGNDKLYGDAGADNVNGFGGNDLEVGGPGKDVFDQVFNDPSERGLPDAGIDTIDSRDGEIENPACSKGDTEIVDRVDSPDDSCKKIRFADTSPKSKKVAVAVSTTLTGSIDGDTFPLRVKCVKAAVCTGAVIWGDSDTAAPFTIKRGRTKAVKAFPDFPLSLTGGRRTRIKERLYLETYDAAGHTRTQALRVSILPR
jgi:hypothetical protein